MPFAFMPIVWAVVIAGVLGAAYLVVDAIGDRRESSVRAVLEPKIARAESERDQWKSAHNKLLDDAKRADDDNKEKLKGALTAKRAAEKAEAEKIGLSLPAAAEPKRVRNLAKRPASSGKDGDSGPGLQWFQSLFGAAGKG